MRLVQCSLLTVCLSVCVVFINGESLLSCQYLSLLDAVWCGLDSLTQRLYRPTVYIISGLTVEVGGSGLAWPGLAWLYVALTDGCQSRLTDAFVVLQ